VLQGLGAVLVAVLLALWLSSAVEARLHAAAGLDNNLRVVLARLSKALLILLAVLISLPLVGIDLTALSVFGGALGVGIGFGLQRIASNYVSGFILLLDRSIRLGNLISVDKFRGEVTQITTRYTVLRGADGVESIVPNDVLIGSVVQNETYTNPRMRLALTVQVGYASDPERAMALLVEAARRHPRVLAEPPPKAYLVRFAESGIELELGLWIADPQEGSLNIKSEINLDIWRAFRQAGIEIPYPRQEVRLLNPDGLQRS
jgi:small-conductance mechanosensitive channel